ncbi:hypothetical protein MSEDJ_60210 [Mycolicibacterium sediminis]|uniref:Uncharacterized protein n=1 Tax=Mycolicibacterium sediminis TaxID=1286180 RepID=A0A7I7R046_9MYCO|nr:hypothetical protein MSEDJ_60210 [Mycolicibacterium sediminis]
MHRSAGRRRVATRDLLHDDGLAWRRRGQRIAGHRRRGHGLRTGGYGADHGADAQGESGQATLAAFVREAALLRVIADEISA